MTHKKCSHCKEEKPISEFNKCSKTSTGLHNHCRQCSKKHKKLWDEKFKEENKIKAKSEKALLMKKKHNEKTKEKYREDDDYRNTVKNKNNVRRRDESAKIKARIQRKKWSEIPQNKISQNLRGRIRSAIKAQNTDKNNSMKYYLNINIDGFKKYLEEKFIDGMSWDNYGKNGWHIDHIIPCSFFDLTIEENKQICFNYKNMQPLWELENITKQNKILIQNVDEHINIIKNDLGLK